MITVVHICHKGDSFAANYAMMLCRAIGEHAVTHVTDSPVELKEMCKTASPDIIHQHGRVDYEPPKNGHIRRVLTPHGASFSSYSGFYAIMARSKMEARTIGSPRTEILLNPFITKTVTFDEIANYVMDIYQKVMDSNVLELMSKDTRLALRMLLKAGICGDRQWVGNLKMPDNIDWRQLHIYAYYENVEDIVQRGAEILGIPLPHAPIAMNTAYLPSDYQRPGAMEVPFVTTVLESVADNNLNLRLLVDLYRALLDEKLDEEELMNKLVEEKRDGLLMSLLQIMKEELLIDEGFLPSPPVDNRETQRLRNLLSNHLKI